MKKAIFLLVCFTLSISAFSQEHLTFKGVPINGYLPDFVEEMKKKGFSLETVGDGTAWMEGNFLNEKCSLRMSVTPKSQLVYSVIVMLPKKDSWYSLKSSYEEIVAQYRKKYGKPFYFKEDFLSPYYEGDGYELQALSLSKCLYGTYWKLTEGSILIGMGTSTLLEGYLLICYEDRINSLLNDQEKGDIIQDEI
ncbi:MAG: hypothetical protein LBU08_01995 [Tannerellaceae bacterium]|jgi:hypothetical protein|nr:hypothetical protein [Tannerellaceae bacterium]